MNKKELKTCMNDLIEYIKEGYNDDTTMHIVTDSYQLFTINAMEELPKKIGINTIIVATYEDGYTRNVYLKNGLQSYRKAKIYKCI